MKTIELPSGCGTARIQRYSHGELGVEGLSFVEWSDDEVEFLIDPLDWPALRDAIDKEVARVKVDEALS